MKRIRLVFALPFFAALVMSLLLPVSEAAADVKPGSGPCVIQVNAVVGAPELLRGGNTGALEKDAVLEPGDVIVTDEKSRAVVSIAQAKTSPERKDLLLVGPGSEIAFAAAPKAAPPPAAGAPQPAPFVVDVRSGSYRAVIRGKAIEPAFALKTGDRSVTLAGADTAGRYDARVDEAMHMVRAGTITIGLGARKVRVKEGMFRVIESGQVRGARKMPVEEWASLVATSMVPGTDVSQTQLAGIVKPAGAAGTAKPGTTSRPDRITSAPVAPPTKPVAAPKPGAKPGAPAAPGANPVFVRMKTSMGDILLELDRALAPISVANFLAYMDKGYYEGTIFHRVIGNFMIQGGGFDADLKQKTPAPPIKNEWQNGLKNKRGTIAMARTRVPDSATSQFYINVVDNASLDQPRGGAAYAVFGRVVGSMETVDAIRNLPTKKMGQHQTVPQTTVTIIGVERITADEAGG